MKNIWTQVDDIVNSGKAPLISVPTASKIVVPKRSAGRPAHNDPYQPKGYNYNFHTPNRTRMRCRNTGCNKYLPKGATTIVCCEACLKELREETQIILDILDGKLPAEELPVYNRSRHKKRC